MRVVNSDLSGRCLGVGRAELMCGAIGHFDDEKAMTYAPQRPEYETGAQ